MDVDEYRRRLREELDRAADDASRADELLDTLRPGAGTASRVRSAERQQNETRIPEAVRIVRDQAADIERRLTALEIIGREAVERDDLIDVVLGLLRDGTAPSALRSTALDILRASSFRTVLFAPRRADFLQALRALVEDPDLDLRQQVLEVLAQEKDEYVQRRLLEGLENAASALVPTARAIQLLGYDVHAEHYPVLRSLAQQVEDPAVKQEAIRLLGTDAASKDFLAQVVRDRSQDADVRTAGAVALQSLAPSEFEAIARELVMDEGEDTRLRAASVSAIDHFGERTRSAEPEFLERIRQLQATSSGELQRAARRFVEKAKE